MEPILEAQVLQKDILSLALVGDAVWSLYVRDTLIRERDLKSGYLSKICVKYVNASAQCRMLYALDGKLTETEESVVRRARNAHNNTRAKNASVDEYKKATALEALIGYLHLTAQHSRLEKLQGLCFKVITNE